MNGIIVKAISSFYYVDCEDTIYECKARGNFRKTGVSPVVGDNVTIKASDSGYSVIEEILPRKSYLERPNVANLQKLVIMSAYTCPEPNALLIDRLISFAIYKMTFRLVNRRILRIIARLPNGIHTCIYSNPLAK